MSHSVKPVASCEILLNGSTSKLFGLFFPHKGGMGKREQEATNWEGLMPKGRDSLPELNFIPLQHFGRKPTKSFHRRRFKWGATGDAAVLCQAAMWDGEGRLAKLTPGRRGTVRRTQTCACVLHLLRISGL